MCWLSNYVVIKASRLAVEMGAVLFFSI